MIGRAALWEQMLRADEANLAFFAARDELPGVSLFFAERDDAPEFDLALIYDVPPAETESTLQAIGEAFRLRGRRPCIRLSPASSPADWPGRLARAGFGEVGERFVYFSVPPSLPVRTHPAVRIERAGSAADADRFSAIQVAGFGISPVHQAWDRQLARRHVRGGQHALYLARLDGQPVGAARCIHLPTGVTAMAALATLPDVRGRGVGTSLLARMIADARCAGSRLIVGAVVSGSDAAGMYRRRGFAFHGLTTSYHADNGSAVMREGGDRQ